MKIVVAGAGIVGVTTAFILARLGHSVTVIDREAGVARESSFANGGQLSYGFATPIGNPALLTKLLTVSAGGDMAVKLPDRLSLEFIGWASRLLRQCLPGAAEQNATKLQQLAAESGKVFSEIMASSELDFGHRKAGKLVLLGTPAAVKRAKRQLNGRPKTKCLFSVDECMRTEPALESYRGTFAGGLWVAHDAVGDAALFADQLAALAQDIYGVEFRFNTNIERIDLASGRVASTVLENDETVQTDAVILCTGITGRALIKNCGIKLPIYPITGYSLTAPTGRNCPEVAVTDLDKRIVFSRIGSQVRIAGFADMGQPDQNKCQRRIADLVSLARDLAPEFADYESIASLWSGARPATPNSLPIIGASSIPGLYMNMGHGMFGWTLSAGAASVLADEIGPSQDTITNSPIGKNV